MTALVRIERTSRYRPVATIGRGGMGEALLALLDAGSGVDKVVVLKRIWPDLATDPDFVTMFHDEAKLAIRLNHPNVVQTIEVVEDSSQLSIAMEYLHGQPLSAVLNHHLTLPHQLSLAHRLRILVDVLAGLHYAHELCDYGGQALGVVHRDVNPQNVIVTYDGQVKLMDFGVAKTAAAVYQTRPGAIKGKLAYLAPEYLRSDAVDRRADVFAVGIMLWELLAGRRLWHGLTEGQIVRHLAADSPIPPLPAEGVRPRVLDAICARALAMNPGERYPTAAALETDLQQVIAGAADSHARTLGRVISHAFGTARAEREALIARALQKPVQLSLRPDLVGAAARPTRDAPWATRELERPREITWARDIDAFMSAADQLLDVTVVDRSMPPAAETPPARPARRRSPVRGVIVAGTLAAVIAGLLLAEVKRPVAAPAAAAPPADVAAAPADVPVAPAPADVPEATPSTPTNVAPVPASSRPILWSEGGRHRTRRQARPAPPAPTAGKAPLEESAFETPRPEDRLRAGSLRAIDEGDPFR